MFHVLSYCTDGRQTTAMVQVYILDVNDNTPVFRPSQYSLNLTPSTLNGQEVLVLQATDADSGKFGTISYDINSGNEAGYFKIHPRTGSNSQFLNSFN